MSTFRGCCVRLPDFVFLLSPVLSPSLCFSCLRSSLPACLPSGLRCCVRLPSLVFLLSPVLSLSLSPIWSGVLCLPSDAVVYSSCLSACLPCGLRYLVLFVHCLPCCVRLLGLVFLLSPVLSPILFSSWSGMPCPCSGLVSKMSCAICATVWGLRWCNFCLLLFVLVLICLFCFVFKSTFFCFYLSVCLPPSFLLSFFGWLSASLLVLVAGQEWGQPPCVPCSKQPASAKSDTALRAKRRRSMRRFGICDSKWRARSSGSLLFN